MKVFHLSCVLVLALLSGCDSSAEQAGTAVAKTAMTVTTTEVRLHTLAQAAEAQGPIAPWQEAIISARVSDLALVELNAQVGERVSKGQVLARFDTRIVKADLAQAQANLEHATANATQANANRARNERMRSRGGVSEQELQTAQTQAEMAEAQRQMAQAQVTAQQIRLQDCEVRAVDDGVISARAATLGQVALPGAELFRLIRQERLEWQAELNAQQLSLVQPGQLVSLFLPGGGEVKGVVRQLAPSLNSNSRLGVAYVDLQPGSAARAGMYARGTIGLAQKESLVVPAEAVVLRDGRSSVFLLGEGDKVTQTPVETGRREGNLIEITQGLSAGDLVAVRGAGFLADGDLVKRVPVKELDVQASNVTEMQAIP